MTRLFVLFTLLLLTACTTPLKVSDIVGVWEGNIEDNEVSMTFAADGSAELAMSGPEGDSYRTGTWRRDSSQVTMQALVADGRSVNERITFLMEAGQLVARGWTLRGKHQMLQKPLRLTRVASPATEKPPTVIKPN